jgi:hypothetical protein
MKLISISPFKAINKAYYKIKPNRSDFNNFKTQLIKLIDSINEKESEEHNKNLISDFLKNSFYKDYYVNTKDRTDLAVYLGKTAKDKMGIIIEVKSPANKYDMIKKDNLNAKAMQEVILYYLRERIEENNDEIKHIIITNAYEWFIFNANDFEKLFFKNTRLVNDYNKWNDDKKVSSLTEHFYKEIAGKYINEVDKDIHFVHIDLRDYRKILKSTQNEDEKKLIPLFKILSTTHLLKESFLNDSNSLNKQFYQELLHIIGLEETKEGNKKVIGRKQPDKRENGALIENTIRILENDEVLNSIENPGKYGENKDDRIFNIAIELNITWINRVIFLKLLEAQLVNYHKGDSNYKFLETRIITNYDDLYELFHEVLAKKISERSTDIFEKFKNIPYLNSSLFEQSDLEKKTIRISNLKDRFHLPLYKQSILKGNYEIPLDKLHTLEYLLMFLDAYDFASDSIGNIQEENKNLINASVLGRIFEKINGYKDGSFFTPGFITMYMAKETLRRAVFQKFNDIKGWGCNSFDELKDKITDRKEANKIINSLKICDPAVGSGHFLVSALNELLAIKSDLDVLCYRDGSRVRYYKVEVANDELSVYDEELGELFEYTVNEKGVPPKEKQKLQETLFHEKQTIIENCLFGVDINPNSVNICRLRLWIELLKNAYYSIPISRTGIPESFELITLPNIDINIKQGNSLISRFDLSDDYSKMPMQVQQKMKLAIQKYKDQVFIYKNTNDKETRNKSLTEIKIIKEYFSGIVNPTDKEYILLKKKESEFGEIPLLFDRKEKEEYDKKVVKLGEEIKELRAKYEEKLKTIYGNAFEWRFEFPEVLDDEGRFIGFDVVIGNPPYIRAEEIKDYTNYFRANYQVFVRGADIYFYFYELSYNILKQNGKHCFINNNYDKTTAGKILRSFVNNKFSIILYIDLTAVNVFDEATTYPIVILTEKSSAKNLISFLKIEDEATKFNINYYQESNFISIDQGTLTDKFWNFNVSTDSILLNKLVAYNTIKEIYGKSYYGVKTALNEAFISTGIFKLKYDILKKVQEGKDIKKWLTAEGNKIIVIIENGYTKKIFGELDEETAFVKMSQLYPEVLRYMLSFKTKAKNRNDQGEYWWELRNCAYYDLFEKTKIIFPNLQNINKFSWDENRSFINAPAVFFPTTDKFLLGILNSKLIWYFLKRICVVRRGGYIEVKPQYFEQIPVPSIKEDQKILVTSIVDKILATKKLKPDKNISLLENEIDQIVYKLYGLTKEEINIVEKSFNK